MSKSSPQISNEDLIERLQEGETRFRFMKMNGSLREARGTTNPSLIPIENHPDPDQKQKLSENVIRYYDLDEKWWRSLRVETLIFEV
jgi:hypothetical protein